MFMIGKCPQPSKRGINLEFFNQNKVQISYRAKKHHLIQKLRRNHKFRKHPV